MFHTADHDQRQLTLLSPPYALDIRALRVSRADAMQAVQRATLLDCACGVDAAPADGECVVRILVPLSRRPIREEVARVVAYVVESLGLANGKHRELIIRGHTGCVLHLRVAGDALDVERALRLAPPREYMYRARGRS